MIILKIKEEFNKYDISIYSELIVLKTKSKNIYYMISITKHEDDWFIVHELICLVIQDKEIVYKCDQLEGLIDCLNSIRIK